mmetsp:Transcript_11882/g.46431  ORF Transcript_11882/g.46431 Transcript_11882/m.46431 type:complete len:319 (-) Transcript_11882:1430-2386(-)
MSEDTGHMLVTTRRMRRRSPGRENHSCIWNGTAVTSAGSGWARRPNSSVSSVPDTTFPGVRQTREDPSDAGAEASAAGGSGCELPGSAAAASEGAPVGSSSDTAGSMPDPLPAPEAAGGSSASASSAAALLVGPATAAATGGSRRGSLSGAQVTTRWWPVPSPIVAASSGRAGMRRPYSGPPRGGDSPPPSPLPAAPAPPPAAASPSAPAASAASAAAASAASATALFPADVVQPHPSALSNARWLLATVVTCALSASTSDDMIPATSLASSPGPTVRISPLAAAARLPRCSSAAPSPVMATTSTTTPRSAAILPARS